MKIAVHTQGLLLEEKEAGVDEFEKFGEVVEIVEDDQLVGPSTLMVANGEEKTLAGNNWEQLLDKERQEYAADCCEVEVVHLEQKAELEWRAFAHQLAATENDNVVCEQGDGTLLQRRHGRLAGNEAEVLRLVADDGLKGGFKDGP